MIISFKAEYGSTIDLHREGEIQGYEFLEPPVEFRFVRNGVPLCDWATPACGYVSLLHPEVNNSIVTTRGMDAMHLAIETRGLAGTFTLLVWPGE